MATPRVLNTRRAHRPANGAEGIVLAPQPAPRLAQRAPVQPGPGQTHRQINRLAPRSLAPAYPASDFCPRPLLGQAMGAKVTASAPPHHRGRPLFCLLFVALLLCGLGLVCQVPGLVGALAPIQPPALGTDSLLTQEARAQLDAFLNNQPAGISVWMQDLTTGELYEYGAQASYYCASTLKAPYALWLCRQAEDGQLDLSAPVGESTGWQQLEAMIAQSSNPATRLLDSLWPGTEESGFGDFLCQLGYTDPASCQMVESGIQGQVTAADSGKAMLALQEYFETGSPTALQLKAAFLSADHPGLYCPAPAARKYGSWDDAFHDTAIVYAQRPYILSVFTSWGDQTVDFPRGAVAMMGDLGRLAAQIMQAE